MINKLFLISFFISTMFADIHVFNRTSGIEFELQTLKDSKTLYVSTKDIAKCLSSKLYENSERKKLVIYTSGRKIKISGSTSFIIIDDKSYQMFRETKIEYGDIYVPAEEFFNLLKIIILPGLTFDIKKEYLEIDVVRFDITGIKIESKSNGTIIRLATKKPFSERHISSFINKHGWYYITVADAVVDTLKINTGISRGIVNKIESDQIGETAQIAFKIRSKVISHDWYQSLDPNEIIITLRTPLSKVEDHIDNIKDQWMLNTVVIDPGHGGKDPGATGKYGTKEKDIVLDISKRLGRLLERNAGIKVVYTRDEDVFIPLIDRTKIANESNGKIFLSIHANAHSNRKIQGFETFLLSPGKNEDAIEVASRENSVIKMEERVSQYENLKGENLIMATMAQASFMKESEDLAAKIQVELDKKLDTPNRGVKQAGFFVLIGASMPNVLVEVGFLSNPSEEKRLKQSSHKEKIAKAIYEGIKRFKISREKILEG
jgi:N-acetylmuramoyl-L-alanine amidase